MLPTDTEELTLSRAEISTITTNPRAARAVESLFQLAGQSPEAINEATETAESAAAAAGTAQTTADDAAADAAAAAAVASGAASGVTALAAAPYLTSSASGALSNERVLSGLGVTLDLTSPGFANLVIAVGTILGYTPANKAGDLIGPSTFTGNVDIQGEVRGDTLRLDAAPAVSVTAASHALPINLNGTTYYLKLSSTP